VILVAVGTFIHGFDELVVAADHAAAALGLAGFAQIGHSRAIPQHLAWERFLPPEALAARMAQARVVVCHGGIGIIGEAMRAGKPIIAMLRRGRPSRASPAGDQTALVRRLAQRHGIEVCDEPADLASLLQGLLGSGRAVKPYDLVTDVPYLVARFLTATGASRP
jgi:UDP-N-acetylglucosamine transferase subunit ALG13